MSDYFPPEMVAEILKRLPVKSVLRFRCVCRYWNSLIPSPDFISQQLSHSSSSPSTTTLVRRYSKLHSKEFYTLFYDETFDNDNSTRLCFPFHGIARYYFRIVGVCNGLLCLSADLFGWNETFETIIVWNPSIKRAITLPTPSYVFDRYGDYVFALGFGFDSESNDFKVVRVSYLSPNSPSFYRLPPKVEVFSLLSGSWRQLENNIESYITRHLWSQAVIHRSVHWVSYKVCEDDDERSHNIVLKFDLHTEKFIEMCLPLEIDGSSPTTIFAIVVKGCFSVLCTNDFMQNSPFHENRDAMSECAIWMMKDYGNVESWTLLFNVSLETEMSRMLGLNGDDEILFAGENGELVSYNLENKAVTCTGICGTKNSFFVSKYAESLVLLNMGDKVEKTEPDYENKDEEIEEDELWLKRTAMLDFDNTLTILTTIN